MAKSEQFIEKYSLKQDQAGELSLFLYFNEMPTVNLHDKWVEETADLPKIVQKQLEAIDKILTACKLKGLCDKRSSIILKGIQFFDPEFQTYANVYVHQSKESGMENMRLFCEKPPIFTDVEYHAQGYAIVHIHGDYNQAYQQEVGVLLRANGIREMPQEKNSVTQRFKH